MRPAPAQRSTRQAGQHVVRRPPVLRDLIKFSAYKEYLLRIPNAPFNTWQVWAHKVEGGWATQRMPDYPSAFARLKELYPQSKYDDLCIVSRGVLFKEPGQSFIKGFGKDTYTVFISDFAHVWDHNQYQWCMRCRRPTLFCFSPSGHRALHKAPVLTSDDPYRCYYCGARRSLAGGS